MRLRDTTNLAPVKSNEKIIRKVLAADNFDIRNLYIENETVRIHVTNTKFRSTAQAVGRISSTLQRFTSNEVNTAEILFFVKDLQVASYTVDLDKITTEQFNPSPQSNTGSIIAKDLTPTVRHEDPERFSWGIGPYFAHRLFNPDLPLSVETGLEINAGVQLTPGLSLNGNLRKSILTNLTDNKRRSNSILPRVHSDWPLYDFAGQNGHIHNLKLSYFKNLAPSFYGRAHAGLLEPFYAGIGGELLFKRATSPFAFGLDIHHVFKRNYNMLFGIQNYQTTVGHLSAYYDAGGILKVEMNAGRYLAGDWGVTTTISRKFGSGWEIGGYATLTDVPFDTFGEGSFDKAIYVSVPIDWIISSPERSKRRLNIRPITRDGGANLSSARSLHRIIEGAQNANFQREIGRLWR